MAQTEKFGLFTSADAENLGAADRARTLSSGTTVLHFDDFRGLDFSLGATLYTICLHDTPPMPKLSIG